MSKQFPFALIQDVCRNDLLRTFDFMNLLVDFASKVELASTLPKEWAVVIKPHFLV